MKSIMISIQPKWCELIASGRKTVEVRKTCPKLETPFKCYIYCTRASTSGNALLVSIDGKQVTIGDYRNAFNCDVCGRVDWTVGNGKVIGEFVCDSIDEIKCNNGIQAYYNNREETRLTDFELRLYATAGKPLYFWNISNLKIYDSPKSLSEFRTKCKRDDDVCGNCDNHGLVRDGLETHGSCLTNGYKPLTRAPQSWFCVEEL